MEDEIVEPYYAGWLSLLPPVIAITLALLTKEVISSLLIGILTGTFIYSAGMNSDVLFMGTIESAFDTMANKVDFNILVFCTLLGALVYTISMAGGTRAYGKWATRRIKSRKAALLSTGGLGAFIFIDDYFNCLTVGTVMKPVTDSYKISRAKLAYIIDATAAPICIIAPISSWAAAVGSNLRTTGAFSSDFAAFVSTIPYNFYALLSIAMVGLICLTNSDFGPMRTAEERAQHGDLGAVDGSSEKQVQPAERGTVWDMLLPIGSLIVFAVLGLLYSGGYWGKDPAFHTMGAAFGNCTAAKALVWASVGALTVSFLLFVPRGLLSFRTFMDGAVEGMKAMLPANIILVLAWTISGVCRDLLQTPIFVQSLVADGGVSGAFLPAIVFLIAGFLSFSTGTAWGTFGILIPIIVPVVRPSIRISWWFPFPQPSLAACSVIIAPPFRIRPFSPVPVPDVIISNTYRHSWVMRASWLFAASSVTLSPDLPRPICGGALALPLSCCSSVCSFCTCWAIKGLQLEKRPQSGEMPDSPRKKSDIWEGGLGSALFFVRAWD